MGSRTECLHELFHPVAVGSFACTRRANHHLTKQHHPLKLDRALLANGDGMIALFAGVTLSSVTKRTG